MMRQFKWLVFIFIITFLPTACFAGGDLDKKIQAVIERTKANMVFVKGGTFKMGDPGTDVKAEDGTVHHLPLTMFTNDDFVHKVTLDSYYIDKFEVTYAEYDVFTEATGRPKYLEEAINQPWRQGAYPTGVPSWYDAKAYCQWIAKLTGLPFDLPTEAQWEYAARSRGKDVWFATDDGEIDLGRNIVSKKKYDVNLKPVGSFPPNPLGLYDMTGNVSEWTKDWYGANYYKISLVNNPQGPNDGEEKVARGGSFVWSEPSTVYQRENLPPNAKGGMLLGFRCVCNTPSTMIRKHIP